jgi:large subunit ribosomal protein L7/L12
MMADDDQKQDQAGADQAADEPQDETPAAPETDGAKEATKADDKPVAAPKAAPKAEAKPAAAKADQQPEETKPAKDYSKEVTGIIEQIEKMTVLEVADLVSAIEDKFGVSAAPVAVAGAAPAAGAGGDEGAEEKSSYTVHLAAAGDQKINVIKAIREVTQLGLKEAKDLVDGAPKDVKADVPKEEADEAKQKLEAAGAAVELK